MGEQDAAHLRAFIDNDVDLPTLGLLYGRRRIGKSTMLVEAVEEHGGFYFEATRVETPVQLERLGRALGDHLGVGRIALADWEEAVDALIRLGGRVLRPDRLLFDRRECGAPARRRPQLWHFGGLPGFGRWTRCLSRQAGALYHSRCGRHCRRPAQAFRLWGCPCGR